MKTVLILTALMVGFLLSACTTSPAVQYYILEPISAPSPAAAENNSRRTIGIGPLTVPTLLESKKIVTRLTDNTVQIAQFHQWASPLQDNLLQTLTRNLSILQPDAVVRAYPWSGYGSVDLQIVIDIVRFDASPGKSVNLEADWTIKNEKTNTVLKTGHSVINQPCTSSSYPDTVHALSLILGKFSEELSVVLDGIGHI
ncbi:MAG: membrane integrity-associated transporter subunit PqiC [Methylococcaceae bacterium]|nr:membrane integrity-associated transporter subunit PqiC [Methylococcaceae bacterium]